MKRNKSLLYLVCMMLVAGIVAGCSGNNGNKAPEPTAGNQGTTNEAKETDAPDLSPVEYTISTSDDKLNWDAPITNELTKRTGVSLKYDVVVGDQFQKWDLWLAGGDYPDIVVMDTAHIQKYADAGAIIPLNDLIDQYGPNIKEKFGKFYNLLKDKDGNITSLYNVNLSEEPAADSAASFVVQMEVLKAAGYPEVKTFDQLYEVIKNYADQNPKIDGQDTIGYSAAMNGWTVNIEFNNPIISALGLPDHGNFRIDGSNQVTYNPVTNEAKQYYAFLNKLYNEGLLDKESFSLDYGAIKAKMAQGRVLAAYAPKWFVEEPNNLLKSEGKNNRMYAHLPIYFDGVTEDRSNASTPTGAGSFQWAITTKAKNPERIIQFIDYLFTDEGQILTHWGLEGTHYDVVDGKRTVKPELVERRIADPLTNYQEGFYSPEGSQINWFTFGVGAKLGDGDYATHLTKESVMSTYDPMTKEVLAAYGKETWADFLPKSQYVPGFLWQLSPPQEAAVQIQKIEDHWKQLLPKIILSKTAEEFEKEWNSMVETIEKDGLKEMEAAYTKVWQEFVAKYEAAVGQ
ncbi:MAG: extracellular solute-binding protein [Paenibacillus sp.]|nr:extracellular solute-binding protein [Paenibacillus sp.]